MSEINSYCLKHSIGQVILPKSDDEDLQHKLVSTQKISIPKAAKYFINDA